MSRAHVDGGRDAQTFRFESRIGSGTVGIHRVVWRCAGPDCIRACIEDPFCGQFSNFKALVPTLGAAVFAGELAGLPWSTIHLGKVMIHATALDDAKKS